MTRRDIYELLILAAVVVLVAEFAAITTDGD